MNRAELFKNITDKRSFLCVGLDSDIKKLPSHLQKEKDPVFEFNRRIIDATADFAVAYKPNIAFYEALGPKGWESLVKTLEYIPDNIFTIADAKRGDIGNTASLYARTFFDKSSSGLDFDSVTVAPYMGEDSVKPFLEFENKWAIVLGLTSNEGSQDFQILKTEKGNRLFEEVMTKTSSWGTTDQLMFVVGATRGQAFEDVRKVVPEHFLLVPGVGAQGGDLATVAQYGMNNACGLLVNSSRNIIFASSDEDFDKKAGEAAGKLRDEMSDLLEKYL
jgi:orotidine-5'-phosphate decarboxylase